MLHGNEVRNIVKRLRTHFIEELGWDNYNSEFTTMEGNFKEKVFGICEKRRYVLFCTRKEHIANQTKFQEELKRLIYENVVVFIGKDSWTWQIITSDGENSKFVQRVHTRAGFVPSIKFNLEDEGNIYITNVCNKVQQVFKKGERHNSFYKAINTGD